MHYIDAFSGFNVFFGPTEEAFPMEEDSLTEATDRITSVKGSLIDERTMVDHERTLFDIVKEMEEQFDLMMSDIKEVRELERKKRFR